MDLEHYREHLRFLVEVQVASRWNGKLDLSGVVQQTMLEAHQASEDLEKKSQQEVLKWLRRILNNNLIDEIRRNHADRRDVRRERSLEEQLEQSSVRIEALLVARDPSPSHRLKREEQMREINEALSQLPDDQMQAFSMHFSLGLSLVEVAAEMNRSQGAAASLIMRAKRRLQQILEGAEEAKP